MDNNYDTTCAYVGQLYLESRNALFLLKQQIAQLQNELAAKEQYIQELERKLGGSRQ